MKRLIDWMETAGAASLLVITAVIAVSVTTRYVFNWPLPDGDALGRLLLGIVVFWGLAGACHYDEHIRVDLIWERMPPKWRRAVDLFALAFTLAALALLAWGAGDKILSTFRSNEHTYDLRIPLWPFHALAWIGILAAVTVLASRLVRELTKPRPSGPGN